MTVADLPMSAGALFGTSTDQGVSSDAAAIREQLTRALKAFAESFSIRDAYLRANAALREAVAEASAGNWDGYGALPVSPRTKLNAARFLRSLPSTVPSPDIAVDPDGEVAFEWRAGPNRAFSVSIGEGETITFAGLNGRRKVHGTDLLLHEIPDIVLQHLGRTLVE